MDWAHFTVLSCFALLTVAILAWLRLYRHFGGEGPPPGSRHRRSWQLLIVAITALLILAAVLIVLSSDPGNPEDYRFWY